LKKQFISSSLNLSDYIISEFLVPEKPRNLRIRYLAHLEMEIRKKSPEVLQETEKETHQSKTPIFKRTPGKETTLLFF
jgi:hypothetical protein